MIGRDLNEKRERANRLKERHKVLKREVARHRDINLQIENRIEALTNEVRKFHAINVELSQALEEEFLKRDTFSEMLEALETNVVKLEREYSSQRETYLEVKNRNEFLEKEIEKLQGKKAAFEKYIKRGKGNMAASEMRGENMKSRLADMDAELKALQRPDSEKPVPTLREKTKILAGAEKKAGMALFNCLEALIEKVLENEFEGVQYKTVMDKNKTQMGARIFFTNISSQYGDLTRHLSPVVMELGNRFKMYNANIETRAKKGPGGVVETLDLKVVLNFGPIEKGIHHPLPRG